MVDFRWVGESEQRYVDVLFTAESRSEHPLSLAVLEWARENGGKEIADGEFSSVTGKGVVLKLPEGDYWIGNGALAADFGADPTFVENADAARKEYNMFRSR